MHQVSIGSDNGLSTIPRQAIIQTNAGFCQLDPLEQNSVKFKSNIHENASENIVCKISAILSRGDELRSSGPRLNIKTVLSTYGDFHVKDKTAVRTSYL